MMRKVVWCGVMLGVFLATQRYVFAQDEAAKQAAPEEPSAFEELFGETLINARGEQVSVDTLNGKKVGIYFSAHWCPPCRMFTPKLVSAYNELKAADKPFEIVFSSGDRSSKEMMDYMESAGMSWLALPYESDRRDGLSRKYGVRGIPTLIILGEDGTVIARDARMDVHTHGADAYNKW
ncbi:MAG: redoxin domain-containing protein [Spartobacteria bacterium]|nr:redoxin domain-containing protein [Spartobacteria bacterium]